MILMWVEEVRKLCLEYCSWMKSQILSKTSSSGMKWLVWYNLDVHQYSMGQYRIGFLKSRSKLQFIFSWVVGLDASVELECLLYFYYQRGHEIRNHLGCIGWSLGVIFDSPPIFHLLQQLWLTFSRLSRVDSANKYYSLWKWLCQIVGHEGWSLRSEEEELCVHQATTAWILWLVVALAFDLARKAVKCW